MRSLPTLSDRHTDIARFPPGVAYLDGQYLPISEAKISVLDYGFLHSDATYDVVHVWEGAFFRLDDHLDRFFTGLDKLHMSIPYNKKQVTDILRNCVALSGLKNAYVEFICTRGTSPTFSRDPRDAVNRFIAFAIPFGSVANPQQMKRGLHASITPLQRIPPESVDPTVKNYHWLDLVKGLYAAFEVGADTAMLVDAEGNVSEGPGFNIFAVTDGNILTPKYGVLRGITRQTIFDICHTLGIACLAGDLSPAKLKQADEVFVTSTAGGVMPVTKIDAEPIGRGSPGPLTGQITERYWGMHRDDKYRLLVEYPATT
ncbi:aminotransferase class IV [Primorskyibacter aestuariivivens]|uniref:aminotransferase class IV n=1 Tax=Primorskyibacter aestuariivivens TaxID=1888912 RepID=UPI002300E756|nr:aminotransferase class IV [Primorskyibacter aestuariivivens]MDA7429100.1 aminotransferase class IV [Primorskyibacter aestuariivivens]